MSFVSGSGTHGDPICVDVGAVSPPDYETKCDQFRLGDRVVQRMELKRFVEDVTKYHESGMFSKGVWFEGCLYSPRGFLAEVNRYRAINSIDSEELAMTRAQRAARSAATPHNEADRFARIALTTTMSLDKKCFLDRITGTLYTGAEIMSWIDRTSMTRWLEDCVRNHPELYRYDSTIRAKLQLPAQSHLFAREMSRLNDLPSEQLAFLRRYIGQFARDENGICYAPNGRQLTDTIVNDVTCVIRALIHYENVSIPELKSLSHIW